MLYKKNKTEDLDIELFKNPTSEYRAAPFWAWNCKMNPEMLGEQIDVFKEMGFGGFHMHSRTGMAMPYLEKEFMELVKFCTDKAKKEEMLSYLYDEDRWPSGAAGGYVTKNPRFRERYIEFSIEEIKSFSKEQAINEGKPFLLAVYDIVLNEKGGLFEYKLISKEDDAKGRKWYVYVKTAEETPWHNNQTYVDTLNKEAIDEFIKITYESYKNAVGDEFGKTVHSIFTDEPHCVKKIPLGFAHSTDSAIFPWTFSIPEDFEEKYGYNLLEKLPEIVWNLPCGEVSVARYHYHDFISEKFAKCFADNCGKWCDENGIALTGHVLDEEKLLYQTSALGEAMRSYRCFGIPGIDMLCNKVELSTAKQCQSAVHQYGKEAMLSELYGVTNWDFDFRGHKFQGDWQAALGVTVRVPHLSWASMAGEAKRDYPASIHYQSPWYKEYKYIEDHFARVNTALTRGKPVVKVGVIHPIESYWINFGPEESTFDIRNQLDKKFSDIIEWLLFGTVDFDFICEALLPSQLKEKGGKLYVGEMEYDAIIVPDCITIRKTTLKMLKKFSLSGGKVIFTGECPKYIDAVLDNSAQKIYENSVRVPYDKISVLNAVNEFRTVEIKGEKGIPTDNLIYNMRDDNSCKWLFIAHGKDVYEPYWESTSPREDSASQKISIHISGEYFPELYDTLSGEIYQIPFAIKNGKTVIDYDLYKGDSILLKLSKTAHAKTNTVSLKKAFHCEPSKTFRFMEKVNFKRSEPNVLLLDRAEYSLNGEPLNEEEEILILDNICRKKMGWPLRMEAFAQPWVVKEEPITDFITLKFKINSEIEVIGAKLAIEDAEKLEINLNGENVPPIVNGWYVDKSIKTVALPKIKKGLNQLTVKIPFGKRTNTEWCYILGEFCVKVEGTISTIIPLTNKIGFSSLTNQGMPFYGGNVIYKTEIETPNCSAVIRANYFRGALIKVLIDGKDKGVIAFSPYKLRVDGLTKGKHTVEFVLFGTRINTFGGMHNVTQPKWVGPNFWRSNDYRWCYEYVLKDTGILSSPVIEIYENR